MTTTTTLGGAEPTPGRTKTGEMKAAAMTGFLALGLGLSLAGCGTAAREAADDTPAPTTLAVERPVAPIDDSFEVEGVRFHLHCTGHGDTTVLLIAGWGAGGDVSWSAVRPALAEHDRVCTYDRPGTGTSGAPAIDQTFETEAADLRALLVTAGEPGPYVVVGHSFGGAEAVTFAAETPEVDHRDGHRHGTRHPARAPGGRRARGAHAAPRLRREGDPVMRFVIPSFVLLVFVLTVVSTTLIVGMRRKVPFVPVSEASSMLGR